MYCCEKRRSYTPQSHRLHVEELIMVTGPSTVFVGELVAPTGHFTDPSSPSGAKVRKE